ncbi:hypothetical protein A2686_01040 [Candidatus Woesebacteria bacterium RIFCSPHIGHO2_01_FULL_38_10]|uniref:GDP-Man:Man(1)GlcNAc(2)-PP-Dol alpha-1,3-mannosyltransferase n=1 Tax=Candidatus Woesebacteria bacterium RIFCSPLOWO2_01_FULL_39_10b TaxID=1802517 RepID=A0A1F8B6Q2_9BACT|nr:MAG: hypothetical protein A2686_01040 [Candidatus Woesebacteria bacterium RIFCSPHIGHO2_01_FULL_38_10]OGM59389.1 MAG: hypothetical protein A2892_03490 [Candidatus Woesebacteria bacterium RIFCSPLOWO2_01_FULL_39_10b]
MSKKRKLKIAIFHLAFFYSGGGEKLVLEEMKGLGKKGHEIVCFAPTVDRRTCFPDVIKKYPIKDFFPSLSRIFHRFETLQILLTCLFFPLIVYRFRNFDVIMGANQPGPWLAYLAKLFLRKPYLVYLAQPTRILHPRKVDLENGVWVKRKSFSLPLLVKIFKPLFNWADKASIKNADIALVNGSYMAGILRKVYGVKPVICAAGANVLNGLVKNRWRGDLKINGFTIGKPYLLLTNRHFPQKKFEYAINAIPEVIKNFPKIKLVITGNPTIYTDYLKRLSKKLKVEKSILFTGYVKEDDLEKLYQNSCLYLYTSPEEDFGMGVIEAMGAGVPVIAWDKAGPSKTIINSKTGFLVKPYIQADFTRKIIYLIKNKKKNIRFGNNAIRHVKAHYTYKGHLVVLEKAIISIV